MTFELKKGKLQESSKETVKYHPKSSRNDFKIQQNVRYDAKVRFQYSEPIQIYVGLDHNDTEPRMTVHNDYSIGLVGSQMTEISGEKVCDGHLTIPNG